MTAEDFYLYGPDYGETDDYAEDREDEWTRGDFERDWRDNR